MSIQQKRERTLLILILAVFAVVVINFNLFSLRVDLTSAGAYSVSPASKTVLAQAKDQITATYYLSKKLTTYYPFTQGIADFLEEYASASGGKLRARIVDPQDAGQLADMQRLGLQPIPIEVVEQSQQTQATVYSGIVLQYQDRQEILPAVSQIETLEYDLTTKINKLITQKQKTIAFLSSDPTKTLARDYSTLGQGLAKDATFRQVQPGEAVGDATVLIVAGSKGFTPTMLKTVDDYLMKGGKVLFAVDGVSVDLNSPQGLAVPLGDNDLLKALETWGVHVDQSMVSDAYNNIVQYQSPQGVTLLRYPQWPQILPKDVSTTNPVTSRFAGLSVTWPSLLTAVPKPGIKAESLAWTSEKSWVMKDNNMSIDPNMGARMAMMPGTQFGKHDVVVALSGSFPSALPPPPTAGPVVSPPTRILVIGSGQFFTDFAMQVLHKDDNAAFVGDAIDWLAQDEGMLSIKTRAYRDKSLSLLQDAQVRSAAAFSLSFVNLLLVPLAVLVWAVVRLLRRRAREQKR
jgi:ABC-type uncharacterized transport system involved in gliding motility auxiliary subunit